MPERIQKTVPRTERQQTEVTEDEQTPSKPSISTEAIDAMLDEIDLVLEEEPEKFVEDYQQRGGQ